MNAHRQAVLLCAEDDDLDLVALVHLGRLRGLDFEVRPGVEIDDSPLLGALDETPHALLVLVMSQFLTAERARGLKKTFALARTDEQDLLAIRFERRRVGECLEAIAKRLEHLGCIAEAELATPDASTGRLARLGLPINVDIDIDVEEDVEVEPAEFEVTVRATMSEIEMAALAAGHEVRTHTRPVTAVMPAVAPRRMPLFLGIGAGTLVTACALWIGLVDGSEAATPVETVPVEAPRAVEVIEAVEPAAPVEDAWPPRDASPEIAPTPLEDALVLTPDEMVVEPGPAKRRKAKRRK